MGSCETCKHTRKSPFEEPCKNCTHNATDNYEPMTNADRIRNMTDEELVKFIYYTAEDLEDYSKNELIEWLQSEVEEGEKHGRNEL